MASIKRLKKEISSLANELILATILKKAEVTHEDLLKMNELLLKVSDFETTFRQRAALPKEKLTSKERATYYNNLYVDIEKSLTSLIEEINSLN